MKDDVCNYLKVKRGTDLPQSKLDEQTVREIRRLHEEKQAEIKRLNKEFSSKALARRFRLHHRTVEKVLSYETWRHA